ncbi:MAG TPA: VOC family protein [Actinomycetota bacterium]
MRTVDYVIRYVEDLDRSVAFYRDVLGLEHRFTDEAYAEFSAGGTKLGFFPRSSLPDLLGREAPGGGPPDGEIVLLVEDVDAEAQRLRDAGVEILTGPVDRPWGHRTIHLLDPDGLVVEVAQEIERA